MLLSKEQMIEIAGTCGLEPHVAVEYGRALLKALWEQAGAHAVAQVVAIDGHKENTPSNRLVTLLQELPLGTTLYAAPFCAVAWDDENAIDELLATIPEVSTAENAIPRECGEYVEGAFRAIARLALSYSAVHTRASAAGAEAVPVTVDMPFEEPGIHVATGLPTASCPCGICVKNRGSVQQPCGDEEQCDCEPGVCTDPMGYQCRSAQKVAQTALEQRKHFDDTTTRLLKEQNSFGAQVAGLVAARRQLEATERPLFERWVASTGRAHLLKREDPHGWYVDLTVTAWWTAWIERAAHAAPASYVGCNTGFYSGGPYDVE